MSLNRNLNMYSLNDVPEVLKERLEHKKIPDDILAFASDLTKNSGNPPPLS